MTIRLVSEDEEGGRDSAGAPEHADGSPVMSTPGGQGSEPPSPARPLVIYVNAPVLYAPASPAGDVLASGSRALLAIDGRGAQASHARHEGAVALESPSGLQGDFEGTVPRARGPWGEPVPEPWEFLPSPRRARGLFEKWPRLGHAAVPLLIGALFLCVSLVQWSEFGWNGAASGAAVYDHGQAWRLFSALFAHGDLGHLGSNMLPFLFYGWMLQAYFGLAVFPLLAFVVGIVSNAVTVALYPPHVQLVGASGMVYGMVALWLVLYLRFDTQRKVPQRVARAVAFALLMLMPTSYEPQVSYLAHASGFAGGLTGGFIIAPYVTLRDPT